jgi:hypothetical protein
MSKPKKAKSPKQGKRAKKSKKSKAGKKSTRKVFTVAECKARSTALVRKAAKAMGISTKKAKGKKSLGHGTLCKAIVRAVNAERKRYIRKKPITAEELKAPSSWAGRKW